EADIDGDGIDDCTQDADGDGYGSIGSYYADVDGTDCDDGDEFTYPGAGYMEDAPLDEECLTDADEDGYAAGIPALFEWNASNGDCYTITVNDSWGDGCNGSADLYIDGALSTSFSGPTDDPAIDDGYTTSYEQCASADGFWQFGWTQASSFNSECSFSISDSSGNEVYASSGTLPATVPGGGTDSDDTNASVQ
ncbi:MAG: hypothetical protein CL916_00635, partial [Deltaproteobacteria bacterium]|nr:hypothetical protein [Deltaproteobacteria bacterium]